MTVDLGGPDDAYVLLRNLTVQERFSGWPMVSRKDLPRYLGGEIFYVRMVDGAEEYVVPEFEVQEGIYLLPPDKRLGHKQVDTGLGFSCDEAIVDSIVALNRHGLTTRFSCQGDYLDGYAPQYSQIMFDRFDLAERFLAEVLTDVREDEVLWREDDSHAMPHALHRGIPFVAQRDNAFYNFEKLIEARSSVRFHPLQLDRVNASIQSWNERLERV